MHDLSYWEIIPVHPKEHIWLTRWTPWKKTTLVAIQNRDGYVGLLTTAMLTLRKEKQQTESDKNGVDFIFGNWKNMTSINSIRFIEYCFNSWTLCLKMSVKYCIMIHIASIHIGLWEMLLILKHKTSVMVIRCRKETYIQFTLFNAFRTKSFKTFNLVFP